MAHPVTAALVRALPLGALAIALAACQPPAATDADPHSDVPDTAPGERHNFQCGELALGVSFDDGADVARLSYSGQRLELPIAASASGARYADDGGNEFWGKGTESATLTLAGEERRDCVATDRVSPWEQAAERGIAYRAVGQEPGWLVEVSDGDDGASLTAHLDYGQRLLEVPALEAEGDMRYQGRTRDGTSVALTIQERDCADPMSGERFRTAASLVVNGQEYQGCGSFLSD